MKLLTHLISVAAIIILLIDPNNSMKISIDKVYKTANATHFPLFAEGIYEGANIKLDLTTTELNGTTPIQTNAYLLRGQGQNNENEIDPAPLDIWHYDTRQSANKELLKRGFYRLIIARNNGNKFPLKVSGTIHITQPHGELAPDQYMAYNYYLIALCIVSIMTIFWMLIMHKNKTQIVGHHYGILCLLSCMVISTAMDFIRLYYINTHGESNLFLDYAQIQIEVLKQTVARLLAILVSLGWGITLPTNQITRTMKWQLIILGSLYFIGAAVTQYCIFELMQRHILHSWCLLVIPLSALLDSMIAVIVLQNLEIILEELSINKQYAKYRHYRNFSIALVVLVCFALINTAIQSFIMRREHWFEYFDCFELVRTCFWHFIMILFVGVIMIFWRPTVAAKNYAYFKQITQDEMGEDVDFDMDGQVVQIGMSKDVMRDADAVFTIGDYEEEENTAKDPELKDEIFYPVGPDGKRLKYALDLDFDERLSYELGDECNRV